MGTDSFAGGVAREETKDVASQAEYAVLIETLNALQIAKAKDA
jgi:hypothetical protein